MVKTQQPFCSGLVTAPRHLWIYSTVVLLLYGFFKELKPSEAFLTPYLTNDTDGKNFSVDAVNDDVYPYWTYSYLVCAFFVFFLTDLARYNPVILVEATAYLLTRVLLIWGNSILAMQLMQVAYGVATATEIGYYSYIYAAVPPRYYEKITGPVRAAVLLGRSASSFIGQALFSTFVLDYYGLNYFSMASVCICCVLALMLPWYFTCPCVMVDRYSYQALPQQDIDDKTTSTINDKTISTRLVEEASASETIRLAVWNKFSDFRKFYTKFSLLRWSIWWAIATCGVFQVGNYVQSLWKVINTESGNEGMVANKREWNGLVEGTTDLVSAAAALLASFLRVNWSVWGEVTMGGLAMVDCLMLLLASHINIIWIAYAAHVLYRSTYAFIITIATSQIAIHIDHDSYGFIFGFNMFVALLLQTIFTAIVNTGLRLDTRTQFVVYGIYYYGLTVVFMFAGVYNLTVNGWVRSFRSCCLRPPSPSRTPLVTDIQQYISSDGSSDDSDVDESKDYGSQRRRTHPI